MVVDRAHTFDPAVLYLIERTITAAHQHGKWVGMSGEMAGDPVAIPLLLGLGLDEFSMAGVRVPTAKATLRTLSQRESAESVTPALNCASAPEGRDYLARFTGDRSVS